MENNHSTQTKVIVASLNPVKIQAVQTAFENMLGTRVIAQGAAVPSGVSDQPMTDQETLRGAKNRACNAKKQTPDADYWVGIEGGVENVEGQLLTFGWVYVLSEHQSGIARSATIPLPPKVKKLLFEGMELGAANDQVFYQNNSKQAGGAAGILTHGTLSRNAVYQQAVIMALVPFVNKSLY